jgi:hypothetical protein
MLRHGTNLFGSYSDGGGRTMRKLFGFILIIGVIGTHEYSLRTTGGTQADVLKKTDILAKAEKLALPSLGTPTPQTSAQKKTDTNTQIDAENVALVTVMKAAIAAHHSGVLPKTLSDEDARTASQAAIAWQTKQAVEKANR